MAGLQNLDQQALDLAGVAESGYLGISQEIIDDLFTHGLKKVVVDVDALNPLRTELFCAAPTSLTDANGKTFSALTSDIIVGVTRSDGVRTHPCRKVSPLFSGEVENPGSLNFATVRDPVYFVKSRAVYIKPDPTSDEAASIYHPGFIFIDASAQGTLDAYTGISFPEELDRAVIIYVVIGFRHRELLYSRSQSNDELTSVGTALTNFGSALPTFVAVVGVTFPTLTLVSMTSLPTLTLSSATDTFPIIPVRATLPTLSISDTLTLPADLVLPSLSLTTAPTFSGLTLPTVPVPAISYTSAGVEPEDTITITQSIPTFNEPIPFTFNTTRINDATTKAQTMIDSDTVNFETEIAADNIGVVNSVISAAGQEVRRAVTEVQSQGGQLQEYQANIQKVLGKFNAEINDYQVEVQKEVQAAAVDVNAYAAKVSDNKVAMDATIADFQAEISKYQVNTNAIVQEWLAEEVQFKLAKWAKQVSNEIAEYSASATTIIQQYSGLSSAKTSEYIAKVDKVIKEYSAKVQAVIQDYSNSIAAYSAQIQGYIGELNALRTSEIGEYQTKAGAFISEYSAKNNSLIGEYSTKIQALISDYSARINSEVGRFQSNLAKAGAYLQEAQVRLVKSQDHNSRSTLALADISAFTSEYNGMIMAFAQVKGSIDG